MPKIFRKYIIAFSICICGLPNVYPCAWGTTYEDLRYIIFNPNIVDNSAWWNFYYTTHMYYRETFVSEKDELKLATEWKKKLNLKASEEDIFRYLFRDNEAAEGDFAEMEKEFGENKAWGNFIKYAKKCEQNISPKDEWEDIQTDALKTDRTSLIEEGLKELDKQSDPFWTKKYAFQVLRLAYYLHDAELFNRLYQKYFDIHNYSSVLDCWATHYKSMILEFNAEVDSANFLHAMIFSNSSNKMLASHQWYSLKNFDQQLAMAQNPQEQSNLYMMKAMKNYSNAIDDILKVYELNPKHPLLPLALSREMNKIEDVYGTYSINSNMDVEYGWLNNSDSSYIRMNKVLYIHRFYEEVKKMDMVKRKYPNFYHLLLTNLAIMNRDIPAAKQFISLVTEKDSSEIFQKKVLQVMLTCITSDVTSDESQNEIGTQLSWLIQHKSGKFESQRMLYSLFRYLENIYTSKNQVYKASLLSYIAREKLCNSCGWSNMNYAVVSELDEMNTDKTIIQIIQLFNKPDKNRLEDILLSPYPHPYYFWELLGTIYLRQNKLAEANKAFKNIPEDAWSFTFDIQENLALNPFVLSFLNKYEQQYIFWDKAEITDSLYKIDLKKNKDWKDYQLMGNAWFNFSRYGNSWFMLDYYFTGSFLFQDKWSLEYYPLTYKINLVALKNAMKYYKQSLSTCKDEEAVAEMTYMMAYCYYMLDNKRQYIEIAQQYEQFKNTRFYKGEKCTITPLYNDQKSLNILFSD